MKYIIFILGLLLLCSCSSTSSLTTHQRKAQKKLRKAIKWDNDIITHDTTLVTIEDTAKGHIMDTSKGFTVNTGNYDCDSIKHRLDSLTAINKAKGYDTGATTKLYEDDNVDIEAKQDKDGNLSTTATIKPKVKDIAVAIPYKKEVAVPGKLVVQYAEYPCTHYVWFWVLCGIVGLLSFIVIVFLVRR